MQTSTTIQLLTTASRFLLAAAIIYLAFQLARVIDSGPQIADSLGEVTDQLPAALETIDLARAEISEIRQLVPDVLAEVSAVREQIPPTLDEIAKIRESIPPVIEEVANVRESLPSVLDEVEQTRQQIPTILETVNDTNQVINQTQQQIPDILQTANQVAATVEQTNKQLETLTPQILDEVRLTRDKVDPTLDRVEVIVDDAYRKAKDTLDTADGAGQGASEGAITGLFTGILKLPFRLLGTIASPLLDSIDPGIRDKLTQKDIEMMGDAGNRLADSKLINEPEYWQNPESKNRGSITVTRRFNRNGQTCVSARITFNLFDRTSSDELENFCQNADGEWETAPDLR